MNESPRPTRPALGSYRFKPPVPSPDAVSAAVALITTMLLANDGGEQVSTGPLSANLQCETTVAAVAYVCARIAGQTDHGLTVLRQIAHEAARGIVQ